MNRKLGKKFFALALVGIASLGCDLSNNGLSDRLVIEHYPVVPTATQKVTFRVEAETSSSDHTIQILVNAALVKTCVNTTSCEVEAGPFPVNSAVSFLGRMDRNNCDVACSKVDGYNYFGVRDSNNRWNGQNYIPARVSIGTTIAPDAVDEVLMFHRDADYASSGQTFADFLDDVHFKIYDILAKKELIETHMKDFDFYVYRLEGDGDGCGVPDSQVDTDAPWRDDDVILHTTDFGDCTNSGLTRYSAEGHNTKAFLHESGHAIFGMADEYCGDTGYFLGANEPNIWNALASCTTEQTDKGRDTAACASFCTSGSTTWYGTHNFNSAPTTVMEWGDMSDIWGTESEEKINYFFFNL